MPNSLYARLLGFLAFISLAAAQDPYLLTPRINDDPFFDYTESPEDWRDVNAVLLNNLTSHDEVFPSDSPYELMTTYAMVAAFKGIPMLMYGQEAGALNNFPGYGLTGNIPNADNNWSLYEKNFGKTIPNFKRWNDMSNVWLNSDANLEDLYGRINRARIENPALRSDSEYFLGRLADGSLDPTSWRGPSSKVQA